MYHSTAPNRVNSILVNGLRTGEEVNLTEGGSWAHLVYKTNPIFVSSQPNKFAGVPLQVDVSGLKLYADLPSIVDETHAMIDDNMVGFWWEENDEENLTEALRKYINEDGELSFYDILNNEFLSKLLINITQTAAILQNISPDRIQAL